MPSLGLVDVSKPIVMCMRLCVYPDGAVLIASIGFFFFGCISVTLVRPGEPDQLPHDVGSKGYFFWWEGGCCNGFLGWLIFSHPNEFCYGHPGELKARLYAYADHLFDHDMYLLLMHI